MRSISNHLLGKGLPADISTGAHRLLKGVISAAALLLPKHTIQLTAGELHVWSLASSWMRALWSWLSCIVSLLCSWTVPFCTEFLSWIRTFKRKKRWDLNAFFVFYIFIPVCGFIKGSSFIQPITCFVLFFFSTNYVSDSIDTKTWILPRRGLQPRIGNK